MRARNVWFNLPSILIAMLTGIGIGMGAVASIAGYRSNQNGSLTEIGIGTGLPLLLTVLLYWMSLYLLNCRKKILEKRSQKTELSDGSKGPIGQ